MKKNAYHVWLNEDSRSFTKTLNIPAKAIEEAGFNTKFPVYIQDLGMNHLYLTQNGSHCSIVGAVNGWKQPNGKKTYRIGLESRMDSGVDSVAIVPDSEDQGIDILGVNYLGLA